MYCTLSVCENPSNKSTIKAVWQPHVFLKQDVALRSVQSISLDPSCLFMTVVHCDRGGYQDITLSL